MQAIPIPLKIYNKTSKRTEVTTPEASVINGAKNKVSIITVFNTMVELAFRLLLCDLK